MPVPYPPPNVGTVQFNSHLFLSPIGARTLKMPVPYSPSSVGANTQQQSSIFFLVLPIKYYGVAKISRMLKNTGLFAEYRSLL